MTTGDGGKGKLLSHFHGSFDVPLVRVNIQHTCDSSNLQDRSTKRNPNRRRYTNNMRFQTRRPNAAKHFACSRSITLSFLVIALNSLVILQHFTHADPLKETLGQTSVVKSQQNPADHLDATKLEAKKVEPSPLEPKEQKNSSPMDTKVEEPAVKRKAKADSSSEPGSSEGSSKSADVTKSIAGSEKSNPADKDKTSSDKKQSDSSGSKSSSSSRSKPNQSSSSKTSSNNGKPRHQANIGSGGGGIYKAKSDAYSAIAEKHGALAHEAVRKSDRRRISHGGAFGSIQKASGFGDVLGPLKGVTDGGLARSKYYIAKL